MVVGDPRFSLRCTELDEVKSEMSTVKNIPEVHDADRNDRDGAARAGDAVRDGRVSSKREHHGEVGHVVGNFVEAMSQIPKKRIRIA